MILRTAISFAAVFFQTVAGSNLANGESSPAHGAEPTVFWASDPVRPGEAVVVVGDGGEQPDAGDVFLHRVRIRANVYRGHPKPEEVDARFRATASWGGDPPQGDTPGFYAGLIDEVKIWTRDLCADEVLAEIQSAKK